MSITDDIKNNAKANLGLVSKEETQTDKILTLPTGWKPYRAFDAPTSDPQIRLEIMANRMTLMPRYDLLYNVIFSELGDFVGLLYADMQVKLFGRNLVPLARKLRTNSVETICEYCPPFFEFAEGEDDGTLPCIEEIVIINAAFNPDEEIKRRNNA